MMIVAGVMLGHDVYLALRNITRRIHRHRADAVPYLYVYPVPSLFPVAVAQLGDTHNIGRMAGMQMIIMAICTFIHPSTGWTCNGGSLSSPILGAHPRTRSHRPNLHGVGIYAGDRAKH